MSPRRDGPSSGALLVERDAQVARIRAAVDAACGGTGSTLLITADPGIGKTVLLRHALGDASDRGLNVLKANARELEQQYPYGVVLQLFERVIAQQPADNLLGGAASLAARLFTSDEQPAETDAPAEPFPILHGLYWLVANLAERGPVVIGIDDAHWADVASLRFVLYMSQRLQDLPVCLLLTARPAWSWPIELKQLAGVPTTELLRLPALSSAAVEELVAAEGIERADALARDVWHATRGNPFFIRELLRQVASGGDASSMVVPETLARWVLARIERSGSAGRRTAEALAVLGGAAPLPALSTLVALDPEPIRQAVAGLVDRGIVQVNGEVAFVHPIVQACVYESIQSVRRAEMHLATARLLSTDPAALDAAAVHLLSAPHAGEPWVVDLLDAAAQRALERAAPETAAMYLQRAMSEPPALADRARLLVELARSHAAAGKGQEAVACFSQALELSEAGRQRASVLYELGEARLVSGDWQAASVDFERGLHELQDADPNDGGVDVLRAELEAGSIAADLIAMRNDADVERKVSQVLARGGSAGARHLAASAAYRAATAALTPASEQVELALGALHGESMERLIRTGQTVELVAGVLLAADELELDRSILHDAIDVAQRTGQYAKFCSLSYCRAGPNIWSGRLADAVADAQIAVTGLDRGWETFYPAAAAALSLALLERGEIEPAEGALEMDEDRWSKQLDYQVMTVGARGRIAEARGDHAAALVAFRSVADVCHALGLRNSDVILPFRGLLAVQLARTGDARSRAEAERLVADDLAIANQWDTARYRGTALRAAGLVEGGEHGIELLRESVALLERSQSLLERLRAMLSLGAALRRAGRQTEAREWLRRTLDEAHRSGARLMEGQAADELRLAGARPRRYELSGVPSLTPAELRVATMAASGRSNREVAQALFVTTKAIEYHLGNAYRKLGIGSRAELASVLASATAPAEGNRG